jgi:hypothetical protein
MSIFPALCYSTALFYANESSHYHLGFLNPFLGYASFALLHGFGSTLLSAVAKPHTSSFIPLSPISRDLWWCL